MWFLSVESEIWISLKFWTLTICWRNFTKTFRCQLRSGCCLISSFIKFSESIFVFHLPQLYVLTMLKIKHVERQTFFQKLSNRGTSKTCKTFKCLHVKRPSLLRKRKKKISLSVEITKSYTVAQYTHIYTHKFNFFSYSVLSHVLRSA